MSEGNFRNELDRMQLDQLHNVVLELSKNCFELKKLCVTILVSAATVISTFTEKKLDLSFFVGGAVIIVFFYVADAQSCYYQRKIRLRMKDIAEDMAPQAEPQIKILGIGMPVEKQKAKPELRYAFLNPSMWFYAFLFGMNCVLFVLFELGYIRGAAPQ